MAAKFVRSGAGGAGTGADWANAYTTIAAGVAGISAGDTLWVADDHAESTAGAVTWSIPGSNTAPSYIYCVDHTVASPGASDLKTTGTAATTGNNTLTVNGTFYMYGLTLTSGNGANSVNMTFGSTNAQLYEACKFVTGGTTGGAIRLASAGYYEFVNTTVKFNAAGSNIAIIGGGNLVWKNTTSAVDVSAVTPTNLFNNTTMGRVDLTGVDLANMGSNSLCVAGTFGRMSFVDCKLGAGLSGSVLSATLTATYDDARIDALRSDNSATNYQVARVAVGGTLTTETSIVRSGGASDGTQQFSRKIVTNANRIEWLRPFIAPPIAIWNDTTGSSVTVTVHATSNIAAGGFPNTDDIWIEVEYLGSGSEPLGSFASNTKASNLASGSAYTSDGASWSGSPAGGTFAMSVSVTPQQKGYIYVHVKCAKTSTTFYVDPLVVLS